MNCVECVSLIIKKIVFYIVSSAYEIFLLYPHEDENSVGDYCLYLGGISAQSHFLTLSY